MPISLELIGQVLAALVVSFLIALILTPVVRNLAVKVGAVDVPKDNRRMHKRPIPLMGGLAIFLGFLLGALLFVPLNGQYRALLLGSVIIVVLGIFDDIYDLRALFKLVVQIIAAMIAVVGGNVITDLSNPNIFSSNPYWHLGWLSVPVTVIWDDQCREPDRRPRRAFLRRFLHQLVDATGHCSFGGGTPGGPSGGGTGGGLPGFFAL